MSDSRAIGPTLARRRIAHELKQLRLKASLPLEEVARKTDVSTSTLSRLENAQASANTLTIRAIVEFYKLEGTELGDRLLQWAKDGRRPGWWQSYPDQLIEHTSVYVAYESAATGAKLFAIPYMPVLLQTREYSIAIARAFHPNYSNDEVDRLVEFREHRQCILEKHDGMPPLDLQVIVHETCLLQRVGSQDIMYEQLKRLLEVIEDRKKRVRLRVLPFDSPPHNATRGEWAYFSYTDDKDSDVTVVETHLGHIMPVENPMEVRKSRDKFGELWKLSLSADDSAHRISTVMKERYS